MAKAIFATGTALVLLATCGIEFGGFTLLQGVAVGCIGAVSALAMMPATGWFE